MTLPTDPAALRRERLLIERYLRRVQLEHGDGHPALIRAAARIAALETALASRDQQTAEGR